MRAAYRIIIYFPRALLLESVAHNRTHNILEEKEILLNGKSVKYKKMFSSKRNYCAIDKEFVESLASLTSAIWTLYCQARIYNAYDWPSVQIISKIYTECVWNRSLDTVYHLKTTY